MKDLFYVCYSSFCKKKNEGSIHVWFHVLLLQSNKDIHVVGFLLSFLRSVATMHSSTLASLVCQLTAMVLLQATRTI